MKIKWKIVTVSVGICLLLTLSIVSFTHKEINILITEESNEELKNYYRIRSNISIADIDTLMRSEAIISALEAYNKGFLTDLPGTILV